jgi:lipoprotein-anchoring transpeptidase ErfK/SrfK
LGSRWLPMVPEEEGLPRDLGIHGTIKPKSIGTYSSKGCPRMHNAEVEELYDLVVRSTPVQVVEHYKPRSS